MNEKLVRVYQLFDVKKIKANLLIYGDVSGQCGSCDAVDIRLTYANCPKCRTSFDYISFRTVKNHLPKLFKLFEDRPHMKVIDYDDYKRNLGAAKAEEFFQ